MCAVIVSVVGNLSLALITATLSFRIYKSVLAAVNKTNEGHPFKVSQASDTYSFNRKWSHEDYFLPN